MKIKHLGILLTSYCNLNCRDCADLIPCRENYHYDIENVKSDLEKVLATIDELEEMLIIGGEILMYPHLKEVIRFCGKQSKIKNCIITTNGTIFPKDDLCQLLKENNVIIRVSGYPEFVAPNRSRIIEQYRKYNLNIEDLEDMTWLSMGGTDDRHRSVSELKQVFSTCSMKSCVTLNSYGHIVFCSRQQTADEGNLYPTLRPCEYVDVRNSTNLKSDLKLFFDQEYVSTCNYCDGISCATKKIVPTAIQILPKGIFLSLLSVYLDNSTFDQNREEIKDLLIDSEQFCHGIKEYNETLESLKTWYLENDSLSAINTRLALMRFLNVLSKDYNYICNNCQHTPKKPLVSNKYKNCITVSEILDDDADLIFDDDDIKDYAKKRFPLDVFSYGNLYIRAQLRSLNANKVNHVVCGLSYTQYGILKKFFSQNISNLSITGQDMSYQIIMARTALAIRPEIKTIIFPMAYYQGYYDISKDNVDFHYHVMSRINIPILKESRNYEGPLYPDYIPQETLNLIGEIYNEDELKKTYENNIMNELKTEDFFNHYLLRPVNGGLKFQFMELSESDRYESAKKTAELNERVVTGDGFYETINNLKAFLHDMSLISKNIVIFVPPMTKYLFSAHGDEYRRRFYKDYYPLFEEYPNVTFVDYAISDCYYDSDFSDFEHLNENGAVKLSKNLAMICDCLKN